MSIYTSQGTIRIHYDVTDKKTTIYFVPENDYSIKHRSKKFAVFMPKSCNCTEQPCGCTPQPCNKAIVMEYDPDKDSGIKIDVAIQDFTWGLSSAATHQTKVLVKVKAELTEPAKNRIVTCAEKVSNQTVENLVKLINESERCLKLIGITIPVK